MTEPWWGPTINYAIIVGAAGIVLVYLLRNRLPKIVRQIIGTPCLLTLFVALPALFFVDNRSIVLFPQQEVTDSILAVLFGAVMTVAAWRVTRTRSGRPVTTIRRILMSIIGLVIFGYGVFQCDKTLKDLTLPTEHVRGTIIAMHHSSERRGHAEPARIEIGAAWYNVTTDVEPLLYVGAEVEAEAGAGSHFILSLEEKRPPLPNPSGMFSHGNLPAAAAPGSN
jgi:hypothetical protein